MKRWLDTPRPVNLTRGEWLGVMIVVVVLAFWLPVLAAWGGDDSTPARVDVASTVEPRTKAPQACIDALKDAEVIMAVMDITDARKDDLLPSYETDAAKCKKAMG